MFAKTTALAALALGFTASAHAATARADPDTISISVPVGDLNLSSPSGAGAGLQRVHAAAADICGDAPDIREAGRFGLYQSCVKGAVDKAVARLDNPVMTALNSHQSHPIKVADRR